MNPRPKLPLNPSFLPSFEAYRGVLILERPPVPPTSSVLHHLISLLFQTVPNNLFFVLCSFYISIAWYPRFLFRWSPEPLCEFKHYHTGGYIHNKPHSNLCPLLGTTAAFFYNHLCYVCVTNVYLRTIFINIFTLFHLQSLFTCKRYLCFLSNLIPSSDPVTTRRTLEDTLRASSRRCVSTSRAATSDSCTRTLLLCRARTHGIHVVRGKATNLAKPARVKLPARKGDECRYG